MLLKETTKGTMSYGNHIRMMKNKQLAERTLGKATDFFKYFRWGKSDRGVTDGCSQLKRSFLSWFYVMDAVRMLH